MAKIVLATMGSLGDLYPFVAIGLALKAIGHEPVIASHDVYRETVEHVDLRFHAMRPGKQDVLDRTGLDMAGLVLRATEDPWFLLRDVYLPFTPMMFDDVTAAAAGASAIVAHNWAFGAIIAAEALDIPLARVALSPLFLQSAIRPSVTGNAPYLMEPRGRLGVAYNRVVREVVRRQLARKMRPADAFRRRLDLPAGDRDHVFDFGRPGTAERVLAIYSPALARLEEDHSGKAVLCGFPRLDPSGLPLPDGLKEYLRNGPEPVVFTLGSFVASAGLDFYRSGIAACRALGQRSVVISGEDQFDELQPLVQSDTFLCSYAPHARLFPHARAIVHHGGIGTTGEAMRSGKPQLVIPFLGDQPDNCRRLVASGVARELLIARRPGPPCVDEIVAALRPLIEDRGYAIAGSAIAGRLISEHGASRAAQEIDRILTGSMVDTVVPMHPAAALNVRANDLVQSEAA